MISTYFHWNIKSKRMVWSSCSWRCRGRRGRKKEWVSVLLFLLHLIFPFFFFFVFCSPPPPPPITPPPPPVSVLIAPVISLWNLFFFIVSFPPPVSVSSLLLFFSLICLLFLLSYIFCCNILFGSVHVCFAGKDKSQWKIFCSFKHSSLSGGVGDDRYLLHISPSNTALQPAAG